MDGQSGDYMLSQNSPASITTLIKDPRCIFNDDESGFPLCVKSGNVLSLTGLENSKTQITVMACLNALTPKGY